MHIYDERLAEMAGQVESKFELGDRAAQAAQAVRSYQVKRLPDRDGADWWVVDRRLCSIGAKRCDCGDRMAPTHAGGRLCMHRLAAMFAKKLEDGNAERLRTLLDSSAPWLVLTVAVDFLPHGRLYTFAGFQAAGMPEQRAGYYERFIIDPDAFAKILAESNYRMLHRPTKGNSRQYFWYKLTRQDLAAPDATHYSLHDHAAEILANRQQAQRLAEVQTTHDMMAELSAMADRAAASDAYDIAF